MHNIYWFMLVTYIGSALINCTKIKVFQILLECFLVGCKYIITLYRNRARDWLLSSCFKQFNLGGICCYLLLMDDALLLVTTISWTCFLCWNDFLDIKRHSIILSDFFIVYCRICKCFLRFKWNCHRWQ
jgi:hypothetical protein